MKAFDLTGKVAVVTGGNGGIGLGMALGLAEAGATVVVAARDEAKSADAVKAIEAEGGRVMAVAVDVAEEASVNAMMQRVVDDHGRVDILVNNAGTIARGLPHELSEADFKRVLDVNLTSTFLCAKAAHPHMKAVGGGKVINNGSMMSIFGAPYTAAYGASKGGVVQLTRSQAVAWAADNIQVNVILPGWVDTEMTRGAREYNPALHDRVVQRTPQARWGVPDDFRGVAVFLASPASDFLTGTAIPVDGGFSVSG